MPFAPGAGITLTAIVGFVRSTLIPLRVAAPTLPARSVAWPVADWFAPSVDKAIGAVTLPGARPDRASVAANDTATGVLFHPFALGLGD